MFRALASAGLLVVPALEQDRLGDVALAAALLGLAILFGIGAYLIYRSEAQLSWPLPAVDTVTAVSVAPVALVASSLAMSDARLGGGAGSEFAAAVATGCALVVTLIVAALTTSMAEAPAETAALAYLPAPLVVVALILGAGQFGAQDAALGLSAALMVAAAATLTDGLVTTRVRPLVPIVAFVVFVAAIAVIGRGSGSTPLSASTDAVALLITIVAGALLMAAPPLAARVDRQRRRRIRPETN